MSISLYNLGQEYTQVMNMLEDGEDNQAIIDTLESIGEEIAVKARNIAVVLSNYDSNINILDEEIKRLQERKKREKAKQEHLKSYLKENMERTGQTKIVTPTHSISLKKNPHAVVVTDESLIDNRFYNIIPENYVLDKNRLKEALKQGEQIEGARLEQGTSLSIK